MASWFSKDDKDDKKQGEDDKNKSGGADQELKPADVKAKLDQIDTIKTKLDANDAVMTRMNSFLDQQDEAKRKAAAAEAAKKATEDSEKSEETWLTDPKKAFNDAINPLVKVQLQTSSRLLRKEIFDDNSGEFEFYHGDFKKRVDAYIDNLPITSQNDTASIKNCYFLVLGQMQKEIQEGKIKSRFSDMSTATARSGKTDDKDKLPQLTEEHKRAAKAFGMTEEQYAKAMKDEFKGTELSYV